MAWLTVLRSAVISDWICSIDSSVLQNAPISARISTLDLVEEHLEVVIHGALLFAESGVVVMEDLMVF